MMLTRRGGEISVSLTF